MILFLFQINEKYLGIQTDLLSIPLHYRNDLDSVLIPRGLILDRSDELTYKVKTVV